MKHLQEIRVVLFDLGRVLVHIDFDAFPNELGLYAENERTPYRSATAKLSRLYETGKLTTTEFLDALYVVFESQYSREKIFDAWNAIIVQENLEIVPLVKRIQQQYRTAILSNTCESHWEKSLRISPLVRSFSNSFTSFQIGAMKPEKIVFTTVCESIRVQPHHVLFIDDLAENVSGATAIGMEGIVFTGIQDLAQRLDL